MSSEVAPEGVYLLVAHDKGVHDELTGYAECECLAVELTSINFARIAELSPCNGDGLTVHHVIYNLVSVQHLDGIGAGILV
jgi:hypothetical protein